jgi:hypothetical protein
MRVNQLTNIGGIRIDVRAIPREIIKCVFLEKKDLLKLRRV